MRRKTQEEKRETNRLKQARWRARHREKWVIRQRQLAVYGKSDAQKRMLGVTNNSEVTELEYVPIDETGAPVVVSEGPKPVTEEEHRVAAQLERLLAKRKVTNNAIPQGIEAEI